MVRLERETSRTARGDEMTEAYVITAVRSPVGKRNGGLSGVHPADLLGEVMKVAITRAGVPADAVEDAIVGCVSQIGAQAGNIGRYAWLSAGLPESVPAVTLDRQCGSSQQAVHFGAQSILSRSHDIVLAGGVEIMSLAGVAGSVTQGRAHGMGEPRGGLGWNERYGHEEASQFRGADLIAERWSISRAEMEQLAIESHRRATAAIDDGRFVGETLPWGDITQDEGPRRTADPEKMASLRPTRDGGLVTAAVASQVSDGAAALVLASAEAVERYNLKPLARVVEMAVVGSDPIEMLSGPIPATHRLLERAGITLNEIDTWEVNEAFACVVLAWQREFGVDLDRVNPDGGAMALGHPVGASGARLMTTLVHRLARGGLSRGAQVMCEGGGTANATLLEAV